jgi:hypothetical protein
MKHVDTLKTDFNEKNVHRGFVDLNSNTARDISGTKTSVSKMTMQESVIKEISISTLSHRKTDRKKHS